MKVYGINTCGTYKKAIKWFHENQIDIEPIDLRVSPPSEEELALYHQLSQLEIKKFFNTSGKVYRELNLKETYQQMTNEQIYKLLSENPMLIKRPLIVDGSYVRTGFNEAEYIRKWLD